MADAATLSVLLRIRDEASTAIKQFSANVEQSGKAISKTAESSQALGQVWKGLLQGAGFAAALGIGQATAAAVGFVKSGIQMAAQAEQAAASFKFLSNQSGIAADELLANMKRATDGIVDDSDLMLSANRAMTLGVTANAEQFGQLMEIARDRARKMGTDTVTAFEAITNGVAFLGERQLRGAGFTIDIAKATETYATELGVAVEQISEADKQQALLNAVLTIGTAEMDKIGLATKTSSERLQEASVHWKEFKENIGKGLLIAFDWWTEPLRAVGEEQDKAQNKFDEWKKNFDTQFGSSGFPAPTLPGAPLMAGLGEDMQAQLDLSRRFKEDQEAAAKLRAQELADGERLIANLNARADIERDYQARLKATADADAKAIADRLADEAKAIADRLAKEAEARRRTEEEIARVEQDFRVRKARLEAEALMHNQKMEIDAATALTKAHAEELQKRLQAAVRAAEEQARRVQAALLGTVSAPGPMRFAPPQESIQAAFGTLQANIEMFRQTFPMSVVGPGFEERVPTFETFAALVKQYAQEGNQDPIIAALQRFGQALGIPGYAHGGEVPGPVGAPQLAVVHGGEQVLTRAQQGTAGGANVQLTLNNYGVLGMDDAGQWLARELRSLLSRGAFPQLARR